MVGLLQSITLFPMGHLNANEYVGSGLPWEWSPS